MPQLQSIFGLVWILPPYEKCMSAPINCTNTELCTYLQAVEAGYGPTCSLDIDQSAPSKIISIASKSYQHGKKTVVFRGSPSFRMSKSSTASLGEGLLTSSKAVSPAPTSALPGRERESTARNQGSGARWPASSPRCSRVSSSWRTSAPLFPEDSAEFSGTWPISGSMRSGTVFERPTLERRTSESGSLYWPTAQAHDCRGGKTPEQVAAMRAKGFGVRNLNEEAAQWTTPTSTERSGQGERNRALRLDAQAWATPTTSMVTGPGDSGRDGGLNLQTQADRWQTPATDSFRSRGGDRKDEMGLDQQARFWPTPTNSMATPEDLEQARYAGNGGKRPTYQGAWPTPQSYSKGKDSNSQPGLTPLDLAARPDLCPGYRGRPDPTTPKDGAPTSPKAVLNPRFVEALQGFPMGSTTLSPIDQNDLRRWETLGCRIVQRSLSVFCINA